ncbi:MAG TPA: rhodanese-like domain-containing protein [Methanoregulaceae archaeon]|nr:rhodanese-like domain-containing protein [Methanoregulaceae archaeon]
MIIRKIPSEGLSHYSYFISAAGMAAVVDPRRDCEAYLELARELDVRITHIFETHRNEDYVIGSLELASRTGAAIYHGTRVSFAYGNAVKEGDTFRLGRIELRIIETPGHTFESISIVVTDREVSDLPYAVFTGDALFAGDTGRTDFFGPERRAEVSALLYESIWKKILPLGDGTLVLPAHGAGSVCGSAISDHEVTTVGYEKQTHPHLSLSQGEFIQKKVNEHHYLPPYFAKMEQMNQEGAPVLSHLPDLRPYLVDELRDIRDRSQMLDIRSPTSFAGGHIRGSLSIWKDGIPAFAGWFLSYDQPIILVDDFNCYLGEVSRHLMRLGYDNLKGYLAGGFPAYFKSGSPIGHFETWSVHDLVRERKNDDLFLLDVRDIANVKKYGMIAGAHHIYVGELPGKWGEVPMDRQVAVYCDAGFKGSLGASYLAGKGYSRLANVLGGMGAYLQAGYPVEHVQ